MVCTVAQALSATLSSIRSVSISLTIRSVFWASRVWTLVGATAISMWCKIGTELSLGWQTVIAGPGLRWWGVGADSVNQGIRHFYMYSLGPEKLTHITRVAQLLNKPLEAFKYSKEGFENYTNAALEIATNPQSYVRALERGREAYYWLANET